MALTIEIDHAKARARKAAEAGTTNKVVPQSVKGRIRRLKWVILVLTLGARSTRVTDADGSVPTAYSGLPP
jgi:hypothetical protein